MTDTQILEALKGTTEERDKALEYLYKAMPVRGQLHQHISKYGGNAQDLEDVFQDAIVIFDKHIRENRYEKKSTINTYLFGIAKYVWRNMQKKLQRIDLEGDYSEYELEEENTPETIMLETEKKTIIWQLWGKIGEECQQILQLKHLGYKDREIAEKMSFPKPDNAKKKAYRCRMQFRDYLKAHPQYLNLLNSLL